MNTWWFKLKLKQIKSFLSIIKLIPDLKARITVIIVSICVIISSLLIGIMIGKNIEANRSISITSAISHVPYDEKVLASVSSVKNNLFAESESDKNYVASDGGKVYYYKTCKSYNRIKEENRVWFSTAAIAKASGYSPAKNCVMPK